MKTYVSYIKSAYKVQFSSHKQIIRVKQKILMEM